MSSESKPTPRRTDPTCPIAAALDVVGDRWALLVLRELTFGVHRYNDIQVNTGAPRDRLSARLRALEEAGVITRLRYCDHPPRDEYHLTEAGKAITPVLRELQNWGQTYVLDEELPRRGKSRPQRWL